jgi:hypothetical protein
MRVPCPTCHRKGTIDKVFPHGVLSVPDGWCGTKIVDARTGERVGITTHWPGYGPRDLMPQEPCQSCDGAGWLDRPVDLSVSLESK